MGFARIPSYSNRLIIEYGSFSHSQAMQMSIAPSASELPTQVQVFEPALPDISVLVGLGTVVVLCVIASVVWANEVVPVSRAKLAVSKSRGEVREYLDNIKADEENDRSFEKWLFADWLNKSKIKKESAIPFLKEAKWNSGDNPVLVTCALIGVSVILVSTFERISLGSPII